MSISRKTIALMGVLTALSAPVESFTHGSGGAFVTPGSAGALVNSIGVNTHLDYLNSPYANVSVVENSILYLGVKNLRDSPDAPSDIGAGNSFLFIFS